MIPKRLIDLKRFNALFLSLMLFVSASAMADYDCGLATQNMVIAAASLGYGVKIVSSPTMTLNGNDHDAICEKLGVDKSMQAVAVLLIGHADESTDATTAATTRDDLETKNSIIK